MKWMRLWLIMGCLLPCAASFAHQDSSFFSTGSTIQVFDPNASVIVGGIVDIPQGATSDVAIIGGKVHLGGTIQGNTFINAGDLLLDNKITNHALLVAGNINLGPKSYLGNDSVLIGGTVHISGTAEDQLTIVGGDVTIDGTVKGNLKVIAHTLTLAPTAHIQGMLKFLSPNPVKTAKSGLVKEGITPWDINTSPLIAPLRTHTHFYFHGLYRDLAIFIVGILFVLLFSRFSQETIRQYQQQPLRNFIAGFLVLTLIPLICLLLLFSILGLPLAILMLIFYGCLIILAFLTLLLNFGALVLKLVARIYPLKMWQLILSLFIGILIFRLLQEIPYLGAWIIFFAFLLSLGSFVLGMFRRSV